MYHFVWFSKYSQVKGLKGSVYDSYLNDFGELN